MKKGSLMNGDEFYPHQKTMPDNHLLENRKLTRQAWETVLADLHWNHEETAKNTSPECREWIKKNSHSHSYHEVMVSLLGAHIYGINNKALQFTPGTSALIPSNLPHDSWYSPHHAQCVDFWVHFLPQGGVVLNFVYHDPLTGPDLVRVPPPATELLDDFTKAGSLLNRSSSTDSLKARRFIGYLLHELFELLMEINPGSQQIDEQSVVDEVKCYASHHLTDRLTLTDLAKVAGYSPFHFHRMFLEAEGITPRTFVEARRLKYSCDLLKKGYSITSAALDSGFATPSQFTRAFKKRFELSPTEWIKSRTGISSATKPKPLKITL